MSYTSEGKDIKISPVEPVNEDVGSRNHEVIWSGDNNSEIFKRGEGQVDFRAVNWIRASTIFLKRESCDPIYRIFVNHISKVILATGIPSIPSVMYDLGTFPGAINLLAWTAINTYGAIIQGNFRNIFPGCHSIADMAHVAGGHILSEIVGLMFIVTYMITAASGIIGVAAAFNALALHSMYTVCWSLVSAVIVEGFASVRKFAHIGWFTWVEFGSGVYVAVFIVV